MDLIPKKRAPTKSKEEKKNSPLHELHLFTQTGWEIYQTQGVTFLSMKTELILAVEVDWIYLCRASYGFPTPPFPHSRESLFYSELKFKSAW